MSTRITQHNEDLEQLMRISQQTKLALLNQTFDGLFSRNETFTRPHPINGTRIALEIEHRGLCEDIPQNKEVVFRRRKVLKDKCERSRKQLKEYYDELLKETAKTEDASLGKRKVNGIGVPEASVDPADLMQLLAPHQLGNFPSTEGAAEKRLQAINDPSLFEEKRVLEMGCGDGAFLHEVAREYKNCYLKGVDADSKLIELAASRTRTCKDDNQTQKEIPDLDWVPICFRNRSKQKILTVNRVEKQSDSTEAKGPVNPVFETENIIKDITKYRYEQFDTLVCLSVMKWVHLNWGDQGLTRLFLKMYNSLKVGGRLVIDIHNWKSYKKRKKTLIAFAYQYSAISIKPKGILERLYRLGFELEREIPLGYETQLKRPIYILKKTT